MSPISLEQQSVRSVGLYMRSDHTEVETRVVGGRGPDGRKMSSSVDKNYKLKRTVNLYSGIALIVGTMIGA